MLDRLGCVTVACVDFSEGADCREVLGRRAEHVIELLARRFELAGLEQRAPERDARGQVGRVPLKAGPARLDRFLGPAHAPELLRQRGEGYRRRVRLDPAPELFDARTVGHEIDLYDTVTDFVTDALLP